MNVAQSAAVLLYLISRRAAGASRAAATEPLATLGALEALEGRLQQALRAADFINPQRPDRVLRELMRTLERAQLTEREAGLWLSAVRKLQAKLGRG